MKSKWKRVLSAVLACMMVLMLFPVGALAAEDEEETESAAEKVEETEESTTPEYVAKIGEDSYETLDEAIEKATDGGTIELLADATTEGLNLKTDLTIKASSDLEETPTITFTKYGIALWGVALTFKDVDVVMNDIGSTPYTGEWNWMTICASKNASLTLDNVTMTMDGNECRKCPRHLFLQQ